MRRSTVIDDILDANSEQALCQRMQDYIATLRNPRTLRNLPENFRDLTAENARDIEGWFEALRHAPQREDPSNPLSDVYDHYHAAIQTLRRLGLRR
jgi:chromatin segregation and condensation protein Rec8/ScpA/Scc1 (kleisin family)